MQSAIFSSGISLAKPSIIKIDSLFPETIKSSSLCTSSSVVGKGMISPSTKPRRIEPMGPWKGRGEIAKRARGAVHGQHVGIVLAVGGQDGGHDLDFVHIQVGKQGADGAVHEPGGKGFLGGGPSFAFEETAGKFSGRGHPLAIIASQGEEIAGPGGSRGGGREHDRFAVLD